MQCAICLEEIPYTDTQFTSCEHAFHKKCIMDWKQRHETCPICRHDLSQDFLAPTAPPLPAWEDTFVTSHVDGLLQTFNYQNMVPVDPTIRTAFIKQNRNILKIIETKDCDPILASNLLMREEIKRYQELRFLMVLQKEHARTLEAENKRLRAALTPKTFFGKIFRGKVLPV